MAKSPSSTSDDVTVFVTTSLITYLAITVSGNETISDLKRKLENEHKLSDGEIKIRSLKVNRRGCLYRLSDCMRVRSIASGVDKECFLFADASVIEKNGEIEHGPQNVGESMQLIGSGICDNAVLSGADRPLDVFSKRLFGVDDSVTLLIEGNKNNIVDQNCSVDSGRETSKDMEMEIRHSDDDHLKASFDETNNGSVPETQEDGDLFNEGFRVPAAPEREEDISRKEISEAKSSASLGEASPSAKKRRQAKRKNEEAVHLKENEAPVHGINEEQSQIDIVPPEDSLNEGGDVACDTLVVNRTTTEVPRRDLASNLNNRPDSGIHRTNDTYKESDTSGEHAEFRKDTSMNCDTAVEDPSQSQTHTASKKKHKFKNITNSEDSLKENKVLICDFNEESSQLDASESQTASKKKRKLEKVTGHLDSINENNAFICDSNKEASRPESASELSAGKTACTTLEGSLAKTSGMLINSLDKMKKKKKESKPLNQVVDAAPSGSGDMEERSMVACAGINMETSSGEDTCVPIQELQENRKAPFSLDLDDSTEEKPEGHPPLVVKAHGENGSSSAERVQEKTEPSQTNDSEAMLSERSESQGKTDWSNAELIVTSDLLNENELVTANEKKTKKKKSKGSLGAELIIESQCDISLAEPHEAVHGEQNRGKAKTKESHLSQKKGKDISNKETEGGHIIMEADKRDGSEVETSQQVGETPENAGSMKKKSRRKHDAVTRDKAEESRHIIMEADKCDGSELETSQQVGKTPENAGSTKKKSKRKHDAMTQDPQKLEAEEKRASHVDPARTTDKHDGNVVETLEQIGKLPEIAESTKKKSKRKHDDGTQHPQKLEAEEKNVSHQDPALTIDSRTEALASKKKKSKLAKTTPIDQSNAKCLESGTEYGVQNGTLRACSNSMSESSKLPSQQEHISPVTSLRPNLSGNHEEFSCEEEIDFHKYMVPSQNKNKVLGSGEMHVEEVTKSTKADSKLKSKKKCKAVDSSGCSRDLQSPLRSDNQGIGGKSAASKSSSMQPEGSISNVDGVVSQPQRSERTASKSGTKAQLSDASGKINSIPKVAAKQSTNGSGANSLTEKNNEAVAVSSLKREKSNNKEQNKTVKKYQSGVTQNVVASGKASGNDDGEVLNSSKHKKSSAAPVAPGYRNGSSERNGVVDSGASTTSSDYSLSSESDYSDEGSNAGSCASSGKKETGRSGYSSIKGKLARRIKNDEILLKSSVYKKVFEATKSQPEEDSEAPEFVPDSQPPA